MTTLPTDRELIAAAAKGEIAAFATLIGRYRDVRTRYALRMLGDYDAADEALQAAIVRAFQSISRYREPEQFEGWLFRIVVNECRSRALRTAVRARRATGEVDAIADWRAAVEGTDNGADVQRALDQIDPINREAFILQYIEELTYPQISDLTGANVVTLERQVDRAVSRLRELLPGWQNETPGKLPDLGSGMASVSPSFAVRASLPLRRPEVLNESFEDRLMTKLLRAVNAPVKAATPTPVAPIVAAPRTPSAPETEPLPLVLPPSPATMATPSLFSGLSLERLKSLPKLPRLPRLVELGIAGGLAIVGFTAGYALRGNRSKRPVAVTTKQKAAAPKIVRRTDTLRVVRSDTVVVARFMFVDPAAKSVALVGDFNRWDAEATPLARSSAGAWARTVRLTSGRHEYAFVVDGKHWVTDRYARSSHDAFDVQSSVLPMDGGSSGSSEVPSASARIKKLLPQATADRVLAAIASARNRGLPASALENRALKFAAKKIAPSEIEDAISADAEAMGKAEKLLTASGRRYPSAEEIDAVAQLLGEGADSASIGAIAKFAAAGRSIDVPLRVGAELVATTSSPHETLARVEDRVRGGATDAQLEKMLDEAPTHATASAKSAAKQVAKKGSTTVVKQAGTPSKTTPAAKKKQKTTK